MASGATVSPNKHEKKIINILSQKTIPLQYVGDRQFFIEGFNPDFVNEEEKKIVEYFGDYWHSLKRTKERDERRLNAYANAGYQTLIIRENELLNNENRVGEKIEAFINGN